MAVVALRGCAMREAEPAAITVSAVDLRRCDLDSALRRASIIIGSPRQEIRQSAEVALLQAARLAPGRQRTHLIVRQQETAAPALTRLRMMPIVVPGMVGAIAIGTDTSVNLLTVLFVALLPAGAPPPPGALAAARIAGEFGPRLAGMAMAAEG